MVSVLVLVCFFSFFFFSHRLNEWLLVTFELSFQWSIGSASENPLSKKLTSLRFLCVEKCQLLSVKMSDFTQNCCLFRFELDFAHLFGTQLDLKWNLFEISLEFRELWVFFFLVSYSNLTHEDSIRKIIALSFHSFYYFVAIHA